MSGNGHYAKSNKPQIDKYGIVFSHMQNLGLDLYAHIYVEYESGKRVVRSRGMRE